MSGDGATGRGETTVEDLTRLQQTIARRMAESKATAPEFVLTTEVDMEEAVAFRKQLKAAAGDDPAPSFNDFVVKASALALKEFPRANGAYRDGKFELYSRVNVGIAVAAQDALIVPTIFDADVKSLGQISRDARALADPRARGPDHAARAVVGHLQRLEPRHVRHQALHRGDQPAAGGDPRGRGDEADARWCATARSPCGRSWSSRITCDHRILYGADAAQFLGRIRERLENPLPASRSSASPLVRLHRVVARDARGRVSVSTIRHSQRRGSVPGTQAR